MSSSYNFGELVSCLIVHTPPIFVEFPPYNGGAFLLSGTTVVGYWYFDEYFFSREGFDTLILSIIYAIVPLRSSVRFFFFNQNLNCWIHFYLDWWLTVHMTCYPYFCLFLASWILRYEGQYHRNMTMVMKSWCYMEQMSVNERITW